MPEVKTALHCKLDYDVLGLITILTRVLTFNVLVQMFQSF